MEFVSAEIVAKLSGSAVILVTHHPDKSWLNAVASLNIPSILVLVTLEVFQEPISWLKADAWTLPKPVWGTCPGKSTGDTSPPVIKINGTSPVNVNKDSTYNDEGAKATDNIDGNITSNIVVTNPVKTSIAGTYTVRYNVSDAAGNAAIEKTRTVIVVKW